MLSLSLLLWWYLSPPQPTLYITPQQWCQPIISHTYQAVSKPLPHLSTPGFSANSLCPSTLHLTTQPPKPGLAPSAPGQHHNTSPSAPTQLEAPCPPTAPDTSHCGSRSRLVLVPRQRACHKAHRSPHQCLADCNAKEHLNPWHRVQHHRHRSCSLVTQSCPTLCNPMDCSPPGSSVHGVLQARILERVAISSSRGSSWPRDQMHTSCTTDGFFTTEPLEKHPGAYEFFPGPMKMLEIWRKNSLL